MHGYDFEDNDKVPLPDFSSHGTHVAGIIAAEKNNSKGVIGIAPRAKIMALKIGFGSNWNVVNEVKAIDFAIQNGAKVINASYTGSEFSQAEYDAIYRFEGIFVAAAGNYSNNNDGGTHYYPSDHSIDNIISVAATDQNDNLAGFSNYGLTSVDIGAPGTNILSTVPSSIYLNETFSSVVAPNLPENWTKGGSNNKWGTYRFTSTGDTVLYAQVPSWPYDNNSNTSVISPSYDLLGVQGALLSFDTACDTEYPLSSWYDYMQLQYSNDGVNFYPASYPYNPALPFKWDEPLLDNLNGDSSQTGAASYSFTDIQIPSQYYNQNFRLRFDWITDGSVGYYDGCNIDNIVIEKISDGSDEKYDYMSGTSMAAPYVAGAVANLWSLNPSSFRLQTITELYENSDFLQALYGYTSSNKRLNIYKNVVDEYLDMNSGIFGVYRFYRSDRDVHFYSANNVEIKNVLNNDTSGTWAFEGMSYRGIGSPNENTIPLYRFYRTDRDVHFYTANETEKNYIINNPDATTWNFEGTAYYIPE
ncbi:MAG: S8 family serine peptidase [Sphaerochaetaceae bacterium]|nr:S8 family serine peptidase [Sphaerochaetaceae bacterium]